MLCISAQSQTTPERLLSNPWHSRSFYEPGQYKAVIDQFQGGYQSFQLQNQMINDMIALEENHAKQIRQLSEKYKNAIRCSHEYGTTRSTWLKVVDNTARRAEQHETLSKQLKEDILGPMESFKRQHYGRSFGRLEKVSEFEKEFAKIQKPWIELLKKLEQVDQALDESSRKLDILEELDSRCKSDEGFTNEEKQSIQEKLKKRKVAVNELQRKQKALSADKNKRMESYRNEMNKTLDKTLEFERKRMQHFNEIFKKMANLLSVKTNSDEQSIDVAFQNVLKSHDVNADIEYWNKNFGNASKIKYAPFDASQQ